MTLDVLAIGPHPDDVELSCGGTLISLVDLGYRVGVADLTESYLFRSTPANRRKEADNAATIMGIKKRFRLGFSEGALSATPENLYPLVQLIRSTRPQVILAPYWDDRNPDHNDASTLIKTACFWAGMTKYGDNQTPHQPHRLIYYFLYWIGPVSFIVDISTAFDWKMKAFRAYQSQFSARMSEDPTTYISRPEFMEKTINRARYYGSLIGAEYGEPFHVRETNRVENIVDWADGQGVVI
ncbi:MAG: bacillithiol biosynthesis deacetylase BshB1 [Candidatus Electryoneaceae bacterium]|nr:bacillithiol biosynthesis deacetylase BshB1 [Candidatus Electryoneaceae bacterium]